MRRYWLIGALALAAFGQTLFYAVYLRQDTGNYNAAGMFGDQLVYLGLSQDLLRGEWQGRGHFMPGYPAILALAQVVVGSASLGTIVLQGLVYAGLVVVLSRLATAAFGSRAGIWSAALVALQPSLGYYAGQVLTESLTGALLAGTAVFLWRWSNEGRWLDLGMAGLLCAAMAYMRSEYLGLAVVFGLVVLFVARARAPWGRAMLQAAVPVGLAVVLVGLWGVRSAVLTERFELYRESAVTNLVLMGTWYRIFDPDTWARLEEIEKSSLSNQAAIALAGSVGPRPDLSMRYMSQTRGPYERPIFETLRLAAENVTMYPGPYLLNHLVKAPLLIWAGRNPVRQADVASVAPYARWGFWACQFALFLLGIWQAGSVLRDARLRVLGAVLLGTVGFLTAGHMLIAVDERFTMPALPLLQMFAGAAIASLLARWTRKPRAFALPMGEAGVG